MALPYPAHPLTDGRTRLRPWNEQDVPALTAACQDPEIQRFITDLPSPYTDQDARDWLAMNERAIQARRGMTLAVVDPAGSLIGAVGGSVSTANRSGEVGYWLVPEARGRGHAAGALRLLSSFLFNELACERLSLHTAPENLASQRVAASCGFRPEGYLPRALRHVATGERTDAIIWGLLKHAPPSADHHVLWLNGTFGAGKSSVAAELRRRDPELLGFDPEFVGFLLQEFVAVPNGDFQDLPEWRELTAAAVASLARHQNGRLVVAMTLLRPDYQLEIFHQLRAAGIDITHVLLDATDATLAARIDADTVETADAATFRRSRLVDYRNARDWLALSADRVIDTTALSIAEVADRVALLLAR